MFDLSLVFAGASASPAEFKNILTATTGNICHIFGFFKFF